MKLIDGSELPIELSNPVIAAHFSNPANYTTEILAEWETEPFKKFISPYDKIFLDIGANVGLFALHVLPYIKRIVCVEPTPSHMEVLKQMVPGAVHEQSALHNYTGKCNFHIEPVNYTMNTIRNDAPLQVDCITLKDLCDKYRLTTVDFCKIDIEGSEVLALTEETIKPVFPIINKFLIELHPRTREMQDRFKAIFEACGYKVDYYDFNGSIYCYK